MALTYGFYNSIEGDRTYDAIQMGQIFDGIITDGIYATYLKAMVVKASSNASEVIVQPGRAWFNHTWTYIDADYPVEAPAPEVILDRVDTLVLDINAEYSARENKLVWVQGTPASVNPAAPALINTTTHHQYPLCNAYRKAGTTMIYAADITNRVGTSATPFVTGVLKGINIDDLLSQWDDEFHTWETATKTSFEGWMLNQQNVYTTWYNTIKDQMEGDLTDFEAWFETIRGIIDEEAATHLQAEIDALAAMLPAGSHITVTTTNTELYLRNVTITDGAGHSATTKFDSSGVAVFESFPYVGTLTITSTDGQQTATGTLNTPYFGRYVTVIRFWSATLSFNLDSTFGGSVVTIKDSLGTTLGTVTLNGSGDGTFVVGSTGTYTCSMVYGGQTMTQSVNVTQETTYSVSFIPTGATVTPVNDIQTWLHCANIWGKTYTTIAQVLNDASTLQALIASNNAADYMARSTNWASSVCANSSAMTYIGANNYCANKLLANSTWSNAIANSTYFENVLNTKVPTMTSNTTPSGEVIFSTYDDRYAPYMAFDGVEGFYNSWASGTHETGSGPYVGYKFTKPTMVKRAIGKLTISGASTTNRIKIQASNDNSSWVDVSSTIEVVTANGNTGIDFDVICTTNTHYTYYRIYKVSSTTDARFWVKEAQLYGRAQS